MQFADLQGHHNGLRGIADIEHVPNVIQVPDDGSRGDAEHSRCFPSALAAQARTYRSRVFSFCVALGSLP